jgi:tripartite-type tricarboxylate transporter receptor subunit TctC
VPSLYFHKLNTLEVAVKKILFLTVCLLIGALLFTDLTYSQESFFEGKTLTLIQGRRPGGLGDLRTRAFMPFLTKHIPGNPTIVSEYMPGGGGRNLANHLYTAASNDGLTIGNIGSGFVANAILGEKGVKYDIDKLIYLGSGNSKTSYVFLTKKESGFKTLQMLKAHPGLKVGTLSVGHDIYINARLFSWLMGLTNPVFISGYSGPELDQALLSGEVQARVTNPASLVQRSPEWLAKDMMDYHAIIEIPKGYRLDLPAFKSLPTLESFAKNSREKNVLAMFRTFRLVGSPYILPPNVPSERANILREAFHKALSDPALPKEWTKITGEEMAPLMPEEQAQAIRDIPRDREVINTFKVIAGGGKLPPR